MKKITTRIMLTLAALCQLTISSKAQCPEYLDQSETCVNNSWSTAGYYVGFLYVPDTTGVLSKLSLNILSGGTGTIEIHDGFDVNTPVLWSGPVVYNPGWNDYVISPALQVIQGHNYTIKILSTSGTFLGFCNNGSYPHGVTFWGNPGNYGYFGTISFKTYVMHLPAVTLSSFSNVCNSAPAFSLTGGSPAGGVYSGTGVSSGMFDPSAVTAGSYPVTYTYTDGSGCSNTPSQTITVDAVSNAGTASVSFNSVCMGGLVPSFSVSNSTGNADWEISTTPFTSWNSFGSGNPYTPTLPGGPGEYHMRAVVTNGTCSAAISNEVIVNVYDVPGTSVTLSGPVTFCTPGSVTLTASAGTSYLWSNGATTQSVTATESGNLTVVVTNGGVCSATSAPVTVTKNTFTLPGNPGNFHMNGSCYSSGSGSYTLTNYYSQSGSAWYNDAISLDNDFDFTFTTYQCGGADGMMFVLQSNGVNALAGVGSDLGYYSATGTFNHSLGVELDIYNSGVGGQYNDNDGSHIAIVKNGLSTPLTTPVFISPYLGNCANRTFRVTWNHTSHVFSVYLNGSLITSYTNDIVSTIFNNNPSVYIGFTGGTGGLNATQSFTVNNFNLSGVVAISSSAPSTFCNGSTGTLTASSGGASYLWSTGETTNAIPVTSSGTYTVTITDANGCSGSAVITETFNPIPTITTGGSTTICPGDLVTLTSSSPSSNLWSTGATTQSITVGSTGNYNVVANGCSASSPIAVTMMPSPSIMPNGPTTFCPGYSISLSANTGVSYSWSTGVTTQSISVNTASTFTVTVTDTAGCVRSASVTTQVQAIPVPSVISYSGTAFCPSNGYVDFDISNYNGSYSYQWSTGDNSPYTYVTSAGTYTVTATDALGCSASASVTTTGLPGNPAVFGNNVWNVYAYNNGDYQDYGYSWQPGDYSGYYTESSLSFDTRTQWPDYGSPSYAPGFQGGCYVYEDNHSWSAKRQGFPCGVYKIGIPDHDDQADLFINGVMVWQHIGCCDIHDSVWSGALDANSMVEFRCTEGGGGSYGVISFTQISVAPPAAVSSSAGNPGCVGTPLTLSVTGSPLPAGVNWKWYKGGCGTGASIGTGSSVIITPTAAGTANYFVRAEGGCANTTCASIAITTSSTAPTTAPGTISVGGGAAKVCPGDTRTYTVPAVTGVSFNWTVPTGATINSGQGTRTISVTYDAGFIASGTITVVKVNGCGNSPARTLAVTRNNPAIPSAITGPAYGACNLTGVPYSVTNVAGMTYNWTSGSANASISGGQGTNAVTADFSSGFTTGQIMVTANNNCGSSSPSTLAVKSTLPTPGAITGPNFVCSGSTGNAYSIVPVVSAIDYTWTGPSGSHISDGVTTSAGNTLITSSVNITVNFGTVTNSSKITVKANNGCGSGPSKTFYLTPNCRVIGGNEENVNKSNSFVVYPNPSHGEITLEYDAITEGNYQLEVLDVTGKIVLEQQGDALQGNNSIHYDLSSIAKGIYLVRLQTPGKDFEQKIVIQ